tara:strand:- start:1401 stop:1694 length:294 start_codon:yes stop_codon:yes gene_type:complete
MSSSGSKAIPSGVIFLVWYRLDGDKSDRIAGTAPIWSAAERMAKDLYTIKKVVEKLQVHSVGVKRSLDGELYSSDDFDARWVILPLLSGPRRDPRKP